MKGTESLNNLFEAILNSVVKRMQSSAVSNDILKKHLLGVFMSAVAYNSTATMKYLEQNQMTSSLIKEMFAIKGSFKHTYERKFFIIGLSEMLQCPLLPESMRPLFVQLLEELMDMIAAEQASQAKESRKAAKKDFKQPGENEDEDSDYSSSDDDNLYDTEKDDDSDDDSHSAVDGGSKKMVNDLGFVDHPNEEDDGKMEDDDE